MGKGTKKLLILAYHKIGDDPNGQGSFSYVPAKVFEKQLDDLLANHWQFIDFGQLLKGGEVLPDKACLITFDDGYLSTLTLALPVLKSRAVPAVLFMPTDLVGKTNSFDDGIEPLEQLCTWEQLRELLANQVEIQSHGCGHVFMSSLDRAGQLREMVESKREIEARLGNRVLMFSFPYGDVGVDETLTRELLAESGYERACIYGGGVMDVGWLQKFALERVAVGPDWALANENGAS